ncbi:MULTISPECIES: universal stress protein [unclassified Neisseria]|uniref:universal stress protein n=1 Tax=unclassified Neisseria TaxID=2623750 RepID=UPI002665A85A|nr:MULTISPECIES: universal stress protein [unclassified Neisseria]MDO1510954.1 universal stress protein [Neisseria sp. MVDL19-042950]MDO1517206.1 universal stress protein [Neisseria sp. MVDL18-041461]MDO1564569.1 universal stress protein [Neisseria sp. MVDL20-010259]
MYQYQRIMVPVDDSQTSLQALKEACSLAQAIDATVVAVHVVDLGQFDWGAPGFTDAAALRKAVENTGVKVLKRASEELKKVGVKHETLILESAGDRIADLLVEQATEEKCDLIVMGTHGFSGLMHLLLGSVAEGVIRKSNVPVLLVRRKDD